MSTQEPLHITYRVEGDLVIMSRRDFSNLIELFNRLKPGAVLYKGVERPRGLSKVPDWFRRFEGANDEPRTD